MTIPEDMLGLSKRRLLAFEAKLRAADLASRAAPGEESREEAAGGRAPKRKRARRNAVTSRDEARVTWSFSDASIEAYYDMVRRVITPRNMAQEARREGDPHARPRDFILDETA